jgi:hypothetical protein
MAVFEPVDADKGGNQKKHGTGHNQNRPRTRG